MRLQRVFLGSRVARRVFWLFVLSSLVPLALSDWLATAVIEELAHSLHERAQVQSTRQTALQVFDRLAGAKATLVTLPASVAAADPQAQAHARRMFAALARVDGAAGILSKSGPEAELARAWEEADTGADGAAPALLADPHEATPVMLRVHARPGSAPRLLLGAEPNGSLRWIAELQPSYLWEPVADAAIDSGWLVSDGRGRVLARQGDAALIPDERALAPPHAAAQVQRTRLFLGADFGAADWVFAQQRLRPDALWHGAPLAQWLAWVAAATMLVIALVSVRQIRRTLVPLEELTAGTKRLAAGEVGTRVQIQGGDEFAALGRSFNDMAARLEEQFRALEGLASIDRDVLAGAPIEAIAERVVRQLGVAHAQPAVKLLWLADDHRSDAVIRLERGRGADAPLQRQQQALTAGEAERFASLAEDEITRAGAAASWCRLEGADENARLALLPLRWSSRTQAALVVDLPERAETELLRSAAELRDRLAVAFSARAREREMLWRAGHDSLTGLANRHGLNEFVDAMLASEGAASCAAVLFVDLDHFKDANDSLGHEIGDGVLCEASRRLGSCAPAGALVARQGGDEFVLVLPGADEAAAREVAALAVARMAQPFVIGRERHTFGASVGVALAPAHGRSRQELLRHADMAMYAAKSGGRGRYALFDESLEAATLRRLRLPSELRRALERGELIAHYQPRVAVHGSHVTSAEALVRWQHPERGLLLPGTFIALAEESQLIEEIGVFMLDQACARMAAWQRGQLGVERVSVNVSPRQLASGDLPGIVAAALKRHSLPAQALELEVTESLLVDRSRDAHAQLAELRRIGVSIALDDFGTGYSSMSMLRDLPVDVMKIDRAFVKDLDCDLAAGAITRTIATLARSLGLHLVAEGVETEGQAALLSDMGCDEFQGFFYSPGLPAEAFSRFCASTRELAVDAD